MSGVIYISTTDNKANLHEGHRQRVKERFLKHGVESFTEVQLLETLLFYGVPKKDTNDTAHLLLETFGSFARVVEADYNDLVKVKGIGENAASLLKFFQMASKRYLISSFSCDDRILLKSSEALCSYCANLFLGNTNEVIYVIGLDGDLYLVDKVLVSEGDPSEVRMPSRKIVEFALKCKCDRIVLAHNHPMGSSMASRADISSTADLKDVLESVGIELIDHIIVGKYGPVSIRADGQVWETSYDGEL